MLSTLLPPAVFLAASLGTGAAWAGEPTAAKLSKRCDRGHAQACADLAARWAAAPERACEAGVVSACLHRAGLELHGLGVNDGDRACDAYRQACSLGLEEACTRLEVIRLHEQNPDQSPALLTLRVQPTGLSLGGFEAALLSAGQPGGGPWAWTCTADKGCTSAADFDWDALTEVLVQIKRADPSRTQALLRLAPDVRFDAAHQALLRLRGGETGEGNEAPLFPSVAIVEATR